MLVARLNLTTNTFISIIFYFIRILQMMYYYLNIFIFGCKVTKKNDYLKLFIQIFTTNMRKKAYLCSQK